MTCCKHRALTLVSEGLTLKSEGLTLKSKGLTLNRQVVTDDVLQTQSIDTCE